MPFYQSHNEEAVASSCLNVATALRIKIVNRVTRAVAVDSVVCLLVVVPSFRMGGRRERAGVVDRSPRLKVDAVTWPTLVQRENYAGQFALAECLCPVCRSDLSRCLSVRRPADCSHPYTQGDSDVISFHIYASWFSPPSCG